MRVVSPADTAKLIRAALKAAFPGVKFSVRLNRNAAHVAWTDGPMAADVAPVAREFRGSAFDMTADCLMPRVVVVDGERLSYGVDYVTWSRDVTDAAEVA